METSVIVILSAMVLMLVGTIALIAVQSRENKANIARYNIAYTRLVKSLDKQARVEGKRRVKR